MDTINQLPLELAINDQATFTNFFVGNNALAVEYAKQFLTSADFCLYVYGNASSGKSHLLQAIAHQAQASGIGYLYLPLVEYSRISLRIFDQLEHCQLILLDNVDAVLQQPDWQEAIFHCFNRLQAQQGKLVVSGNCAPQELALGLADLQSRLNSATIFQLQKLSDDELVSLLQQLAQRRGMQLSAEIAEYLLQRLPRDMNSLLLAIQKLDQSSLAAKRKLTKPFVKQTLNLV